MQIQGGVLIDNCGRIIGLASAELEALVARSAANADAATTTVAAPKEAPREYGQTPTPLDDDKLEAALRKQMRADRVIVLQLVCAERDDSIVGDSERV